MSVDGPSAITERLLNVSPTFTSGLLVESVFLVERKVGAAVVSNARVTQLKRSSVAR